MSRLCCPVCWELLGILSEDKFRLSYPGCHSIIYPVQLPEWLPSSIVEKLTEQFQIRLRCELDIMVRGVEQRNEAIRRKKTHSYHLSESAASEASTNADAECIAPLAEFDSAAATRPGKA